ncbi:hypothetical protein Prubr_27120 [Polymorphospora rubra]|uniref:Uncharacterized protein n=1 Tax=Polymorphospora rubra TaxID=338584 RepID=A0A810MWV5_9ACTN|nr:hypothetical protein Prubr_27120 [Polymorphospora rubra]
MHAFEEFVVLAAHPHGSAAPAALQGPASVRHDEIIAAANAVGQPLRGRFFLHRQRVSLDQVVLRPGRPGVGVRAVDLPPTSTSNQLPALRDRAVVVAARCGRWRE